MWWALLLFGSAVALAARPKPKAKAPKPAQPPYESAAACKDMWLYGASLGPEYAWLQTEARQVDQSPGGGTVSQWNQVAALWEQHGFHEGAACLSAYGNGY